MRAATFAGDGGLDEIGHRQAAALNGVLGTVDRAWSSASLCSRQTADALGLNAAAEPRLADCDYGRWAGHSFRHVLLTEPRRLVRWMKDSYTAPHGGETVPQLIARVGGWMDQHLRTPGHTVAITHAAVIRAAIAHALGADPAAFWKIDILPLSRAELRTNGRRWVLRALMPFEQPDAHE